MRRHAIGVIAILLTAAAAALWIWPTGEANEALLGPFFRVGLLMGVLWLAYPDVERLPAWSVALFPVMLLVVAIRPKLILLAIPVILALAILRPRSARRS